MTTQMIKVEGLPEGYKVNSITVNAKENVSQCFNTVQATIHLKKIQPRRIVLEETREENSKIGFSYKKQTFLDGTICLVSQKNIFKLIKETDIPLTKEEPYLKLSVAECKSIYKWMDDVGINFNKITEFIKDK